MRVRGAIALPFRMLAMLRQAAARLTAARPGVDATLTELIVYAKALESAGATASARAAWQQVNERR